jgi:hypothetical protein
MNKLVGNNGFLSPEGKMALQGLNDELTRLLLTPELAKMDETSMRSFSACIVREVKEFCSYATKMAVENNKP